MMFFQLLFHRAFDLMGSSRLMVIIRSVSQMKSSAKWSLVILG